MSYVLEPLGIAHKTAVIDISNHYIRDGFAAYFEQPLPYPAFERMLEMAGGYPAFAAKSESGEVAGFAMLRPYHPAPTLKRSAEVTYFIHPSHTRRGLGRRMLEQLIGEARKAGIDNILASISSRNEQSLAFHRKQGFEECGRFKAVGRKFGEDFDVVWMQRKI